MLIFSMATLVACNERTPESKSAETVLETQKIETATEAKVEDTTAAVVSIPEAIEKNDVALLKTAIQKGMDVNAVCRVQDAENTCQIPNHKNDCSKSGAEELSPLFLAVRKGNFEMVQALVAAGANVMFESKYCGMYCEPECNSYIRSETASSKVFHPGFTQDDPTEYTNDRIKIAMLLDSLGDETPIAYVYDLMKSSNSLDEDLIVSYLQKVYQKQGLPLGLLYFEEKDGIKITKTELNYVEEKNMQKLAAFLKECGARSVVSSEPAKLNRKKLRELDKENCVSPHKLLYSDGTSTFEFEECGT